MCQKFVSFSRWKAQEFPDTELSLGEFEKLVGDEVEEDSSTRDADVTGDQVG